MRQHIACGFSLGFDGGILERGSGTHLDRRSFWQINRLQRLERSVFVNGFNRFEHNNGNNTVWVWRLSIKGSVGTLPPDEVIVFVWRGRFI